MNWKKTILFFTLILPVLLYLFLKFFGSNTFEVPVYYNEGVDVTYCDMSTTEPYLLNVSKPTVFYAHTGRNEYMDKIPLMVPRILTIPGYEVIGLEDLNAESIPQLPRVIYKGMLPNMLVEYLSCKLLIYNEASKVFNYLVLVDGNGRIRGYYDESDNKELDRLMAELKVLQNEGKDS